MEKEWIVLISTLSGITISSIINYFVKKADNKYQSDREDRKETRLKLEQIHQSLYEYIFLLGSFGLTTTSINVDDDGLEKNENEYKCYNQCSS
jgi:hypothetical protein